MRNYLKHTRDIGKDQKVAIVAHSSFLKSITAEGVNQETKEIIGGSDFKNCQIFPMTAFKVWNDVRFIPFFHISHKIFIRIEIKDFL